MTRWNTARRGPNHPTVERTKEKGRSCEALLVLIAVALAGCASGSLSSTDPDPESDSDEFARPPVPLMDGDGRSGPPTVYAPTGEPLVTVGFDPGLNRPKALSNTPTVQWICPAGEPCTPQAPETGYYNLVQDRAATDLSTGERTATFASGVNAGQPGVTRFQWLRGAGGPVADLLLGNTHLNEWRGVGQADPYAGLQYTAATNGYPGGFRPEDTIPFSSIRYVHVRMRARACIPSDEPYSSGRIISYLGGWSDTRPRRNGNHGAELALNLMRYMVTPDGRWQDGAIAEPGRARWECAYMNLFTHPTCGAGAIDIDGPSWGVTRAEDLVVTRSNDCRADMEGIESQPFVDYVIDVPRMFTRLIREGLVDESFLESAHYSGGMMMGIEFFGPASVRTQLESYTIYRAEAPLPFREVMRTMDDALQVVDPGFFAVADDLVYRRTLSLSPETCETADCWCQPEHAVDTPCPRYGRVCHTETRLRLCTNAAQLTDGGIRWYDIGPATPCGPGVEVGAACATEATCMDGPHIVACTSPEYTGDIYPPMGAPGPGPEPIPGSPGLTEGYYRFTNVPEQPKFSVEAGGWCWFLMHAPPGPAIVDTALSPHELGLESRGRCTWDPPMGNYLYRPGGQTFFYNGAGGWCWFDRTPAPGFPTVPTDILPTAYGVMATAREGRCGWDG